MKTVVVNPYCTNEESRRICGKIITALRKNNINVVYDKQNGLKQNLKTLERNRADLAVFVNAGATPGGWSGLYANKKAEEISESIQEELKSLEYIHEVKAPSLYILQYSPCAAVMVNHHGEKKTEAAIAKAVVTGILKTLNPPEEEGEEQ